MKVMTMKKMAFAFVLVLSSVFFLSCQDVIYSNIRKEVSLRGSSVESDIRSIVRYKSNYYVANGGIYFKNSAVNIPGGWVRTFAPAGKVLKLAADSTYLYALVGISQEDQKEGENVPIRRELWFSADGISWGLVSGVYGFGLIPYNVLGYIETFIFCTNSIAEANRKAYFILRGGNAGCLAYELNGSSAKLLVTGALDADTKPIVTTFAVSRSCVYCGGQVRFFTSLGSCTNESAAGGDATIYYYGNGAALCWNDGTKIVPSSVSARSVIYSIGYTSDYLLVGTDSGISHHLFDAKKQPGPSSTTFFTNAEATLSAPYTILAILVANPSKTELETPIYASQNFSGSGSNSAQFDHVCLWSYYPITREWNRE